MVITDIEKLKKKETAAFKKVSALQQANIQRRKDISILEDRKAEEKYGVEVLHEAQELKLGDGMSDEKLALIENLSEALMDMMKLCGGEMEKMGE